MHKHCEHFLIPTNGNSQAEEEGELYQKTTKKKTKNAIAQRKANLNTHAHIQTQRSQRTQ